MSHSKIKLVGVCGYLIGLSLVMGWLVSAAGPGAAGDLTPQSFKSPLGDPHLSLVKSVSRPAIQAGDVITYRLTYSNTQAGSEAYNVRLYEFLPAGVQFCTLSRRPLPIAMVCCSLLRRL